MFRVVSCLAYDHNYWFVLVAAIVCVAGSLMTVRLFDRARQLEGFSRLSWVLLSGMAGGTAIWTTHFVAMLGFDPPAGYAYEPLLTLASLGFAMLFTAAKIGHLNTLPQGQPERFSRTLSMVAQQDAEGFGGCTNLGECSAVCPKEISQDFITMLNRELIAASFRGKRE